MTLFGSNQNKDIVLSEFEIRIEQKKYARRARINRRVLLVGLLIVLVLTYIVTPLSRIKEPNIIGNVVYSKEEIFAMSELNSNEFLFNTSYIETLTKLRNERFIESPKIFYNLFDCTIVVEEVVYLGYSIDEYSIKTYYLSDYSSIVETSMTLNETTHLQRYENLSNIDVRLALDNEEYAIFVYGFSHLEHQIRQMITSINLYNDEASILVFTFTNSDDEEIKVVIENEKIQTIFTKTRIDYFLSQASDDCYRYGIDPNTMEDILIPADICS